MYCSSLRVAASRLRSYTDALPTADAHSYTDAHGNRYMDANSYGDANARADATADVPANVHAVRNCYAVADDAATTRRSYPYGLLYSHTDYSQLSGNSGEFKRKHDIEQKRYCGPRW